MANPKYKSILIKLSGEALAGVRGVGRLISKQFKQSKKIQKKFIA